MTTQAKRGHAAKEKSATRETVFRKRTITPLEFAGEVVSIAAQWPTFQKIWVKRELDPRFREILMLAVAKSNDAKYCSWAHHEWALIEGVPEEVLAHIEQMDHPHFDRRMRLAIKFARELVAARFGAGSKELMREMRPLYTAAEVGEIALVARVMDVMNLSSNTFDAFLSRLSGKRSLKGRFIDEAIMSAAVCCAFPPIMIYFSSASKRSIDEIVRRMIDYTRKMDAEYMEAEQRRKPPAQTRKRPAQARRQPVSARKQPARMRLQPAH